MHSNQYPVMNIDLCISNKEKDLKELNPRLTEECSEKRTINDFPTVSIENGYAANGVVFTMKNLPSRSIEDTITYFRENCITKILPEVIEAAEQGWEITINMAVVARRDDYPELWLSKETIAFMNQIHAAFGIYIYDDDSEDEE